MTEKRQTGSKLANSVRQAKMKQAEQREPATTASKTAATQQDETRNLQPSRRVWPD